MKKIFVIFIFVFLAYSSFAQTHGKIYDSRDGKEYETIKTGKQEWMAQNLNFKSPNSWCYNFESANCQDFGRLYTYLDALKACPSGWRLPNENDWNILVSRLGPDKAALDLMKGGSTGFDVRFGGVRYEQGGFNYFGEAAYFWSQASKKDAQAWVYLIGKGIPVVNRIHSFPSTGCSVRCIRK